ncbi:hypothetical protein EJ05DRAFT_4443 [Pseudovirgaria hyperparasitica]|uniref:GmrSD restriction endonucleases N-terminal domain-containing protein n=1 Tax=Pseudovirgaria hyperparasitica TaxID=470096 RepID=A0A6A6WJQ1_9PEZI|nr:uncharacterized protein EJ05DRAFT_4443 [Pseudovirgaria hyperparasitica]KAF2762515.1 hypothetical protein EJ05DRAFT_4443 [Pseudovirgaria hyperparasitica]
MSFTAINLRPSAPSLSTARNSLHTSHGSTSLATPTQHQPEPNATIRAPSIADEDPESDDDVEPLDSDEFKASCALQEPSIVRRNMEDLITLLNTTCLDLNPDYQRDVVWTRKRMSSLIDSLIENYYVPPIIFNTIREDGPNGPLVRRICVDGKQRLTSVSLFMSGQIPCHDTDRRSWYYCQRLDDTSARRRILPDSWKRTFRNKEFICVEYESLSRAMEEECFARVQMGVPLSPAEKIRATNGPWQDLARSFEAEFSDIVTLASTDRSGGFRHVLTCFAQIIEMYHSSSPDGQPVFRGAYSALGTFVKNAPPLDPPTRNHMRKVFEIFRDINHTYPSTFQNNGYSHAKNFAPIEIIAVACLISKHHGRSIDLLKNDILLMRRLIRQEFQALTTNRKIWKTVWKFIEDLEQYSGATDGTTVRKDGKPNAAVLNKSRASHQTSPKTPSSRAGAKDVTNRTSGVRTQAVQETSLQDVPPHTVVTHGGRSMNIPSTAVPTSKSRTSLEASHTRLTDPARIQKLPKLDERALLTPAPSDSTSPKSPVSADDTPVSVASKSLTQKINPARLSSFRAVASNKTTAEQSPFTSPSKSTGVPSTPAVPLRPEGQTLPANLGKPRTPSVMALQKSPDALPSAQKKMPGPRNALATKGQNYARYAGVTGTTQNTIANAIKNAALKAEHESVPMKRTASEVLPQDGVRSPKSPRQSFVRKPRMSGAPN